MTYVAVAIGFGIVTGILFLVRGEVDAGLAMFGFTIFIAAMVFSSSASARLLIAGIAAIICSGAFVYSAIRSEMTGKTVEYHSYGRVLVPHSVVWKESPLKFRQCTNWRWALSAGFLGVSIVSFRLRWKLESAEWP